MKVFISWSGPTSRRVAEVFRDWLPGVIQYLEPYVSSEDIDKGARWSREIASELEASNYGLLCVDKSNVTAPWLNFEAGALSRSFEKGRVSPFLLDISPTDVVGPLVQFQSTTLEKSEIYKLMQSLNTAADTPVDPMRLGRNFEHWWPELEEQLSAVHVGTRGVAQLDSSPERDNNDLLKEILELVRSQNGLLVESESRQQERTQAMLSQPAGMVDVTALRVALSRLMNARLTLSGVITGLGQDLDKEQVLALHHATSTIDQAMTALRGLAL
jgi:hypothetical protein